MIEGGELHKLRHFLGVEKIIMGRLRQKVSNNIYAKFFLEQNQSGGIYNLPVYHGKLSMSGGGIRVGHFVRRAASAVGKGTKNVVKKTAKKAAPAIKGAFAELIKNPPKNKEELLKILREMGGGIAHAAAESAKEEISQAGGVYPAPGGINKGLKIKGGRKKKLVEYHNPAV